MAPCIAGSLVTSIAEARRQGADGCAKRCADRADEAIADARAEIENSPALQQLTPNCSLAGPGSVDAGS